MKEVLEETRQQLLDDKKGKNNKHNYHTRLRSRTPVSRSFLKRSILMTMVSYIISLAKNVYACAATKITWSISGKVIGLEAKSSRNVVKMKEEMALFFVSGCAVVLLPL